MFDISRYWYRNSPHFISFALIPFAWVFGMTTAIRRVLFRVGLIKTHSFQVPVLVVGNITVGGTGKTPFVIWLAHFLKSHGYNPGIVSRGVGGIEQKNPHWVHANDEVEQVGDEALLLVQATGCPVVISKDRVAAVADLLNHSTCNIVISDDGLQHYRLARDIEIAMIDGTRRFGNGHLLPAGPLRETKKRLKKVDFVIVNEGDQQDEFLMTLKPIKLTSLKPRCEFDLVDFPHKKVHAVAGIGNPERFFTTLKNAGFEIITHTFPDHYLYQAQDIHFNDSLPIIMTEKDAVKCSSFADERYFALSVTAKMNADFEQKLLARVAKMKFRGIAQ